MPAKDRFMEMGDRELIHYISHASQNSHEWLDEKINESQRNIDHFTTVLNGGILHLDDGRGDNEWEGIKNRTYDDIDPNMNIPFKERFKDKKAFQDFQDGDVETIERRIEEEKLVKASYSNIKEAKDRIDSGKIIICKDIDEMKKKAKSGDRKLKSKLVIAVVRE